MGQHSSVRYARSRPGHQASVRTGTRCSYTSTGGAAVWHMLSMHIARALTSSAEEAPSAQHAVVDGCARYGCSNGPHDHSAACVKSTREDDGGGGPSCTHAGSARNKTCLCSCLRDLNRNHTAA